MHCTVHCTVEPLHDNQFPNNAQQPAAARTAAPGFPALARQLSTEPGHTFTKLSLHVSDNTYMVLDVHCAGLRNKERLDEKVLHLIYQQDKTYNGPAQPSLAPGSFRIRMVRVV